MWHQLLLKQAGFTMNECTNCQAFDGSNSLLTVQTLLSEVASLQSRIEKQELAASKLFGDRLRMPKIRELKETLKGDKDAKCCTVREYEKVKENNRSKFARIDNERHVDFLSMLKGSVVNQEEAHTHCNVTCNGEET